MTDTKHRTEQANPHFDAARVDLLYAFDRSYLSLPFGALCVSVVLFVGNQHSIVPFLPLSLQIVTAVATARLVQAFRDRQSESDPDLWLQRYITMAALNGAAWGVASLFWYVPGSFPAQACLALAYMGMIAAEFIARASCRSAFLSHAFFALTPLIVRLMLEGDAYRLVTALLLLCFAGVLTGYGQTLAGLLDQALRLKYDNADLVERLTMEKAEAEAARDQARAHDKLKTEFVATISHELRTPLSAMDGMAQLLDQAALPQPQRGYVRTLCQAGQSLRLLLDDIIAMTESGRYGESKRECDPQVAARSVLRLMQPVAWQKRLSLTVNAANQLPRVAWGPRGVRQALTKLVDNALKFTESGHVEIRIESVLRSGRSMVRFSVIDSGLGVPEEIAPSLFAANAHHSALYTRPTDGARLGLAVAQRIVEAADGEIGFDSKLGGGATFWFTIPALLPEQASGESETGEGEAPSGRRFLVCLAGTQQEKHLAEKEIEDVLVPAGNRIFFAKTATEAMLRARREQYDAILVHAEAADMLAAAPGDKAPILALVPLGEKRPHLVDSLTWPTAASRLYGALASLLAPAKEKQAPPAPDLLDRDAMAALEKSVGEAALTGILHSYLENADKLGRELAAAASRGDWDEADRLARDFSGSASGLGLNALTLRAKAFAAAKRQNADGDSLQGDVAAILDTERHTRAALVQLYPGLAA